MDLLDELRRKQSQIDSGYKLDGIASAIHHIERAEGFLTRARTEHDPDFLNDVIYRTNQAFEGMLKEAYAVLEDADATRLSANQIEQHFLNTKRLTERVLALFTNYRQHWRNPATHDHKLLFSEQEALLAIVNVSAFAVVLLDQIVETISFKRQRAATSGRGEVLAKKLHPGRSLTEQIAESILYFVREEQDAGRVFHSEADLIGALSGFLVGLEWGLDVLPDSRVADRLLDLLITRGSERIIIEVNYGRFKRDYIEAALAQARAYAASAKAGGAILIFLSAGDMDALAHRLTAEAARTEIWVVGNNESYLNSLRKSSRAQ